MIYISLYLYIYINLYIYISLYLQISHLTDELDFGELSSELKLALDSFIYLIIYLSIYIYPSISMYTYIISLVYRYHYLADEINFGELSSEFELALERRLHLQKSERGLYVELKVLCAPK